MQYQAQYQELEADTSRLLHERTQLRELAQSLGGDISRIPFLLSQASSEAAHETRMNKHIGE